ncbi:FMN-linked oxidoreductase [Myriangium duriaei CBS 260.36]|uniref:FMN-linked oxidoreductase n=1 Tax=Myriangium duriaei CBS 260.36 TaxID=1168546 RepID=A0A9P4MIF3_9PEZI|nr:FMN-linked oxidoreductase [Myriangium duriaei CBS 260.36]
MAPPDTRLFSPLKLGSLTLSNRLIMAPLTRFRADKDHIPLPMVSTYYAQRASYPGTLLITEATFISPQAGGYANVPGIWSQAQIAAWKEIVAAVHAQGSYIFLQLWHLGRGASATELAKDGLDVVSASDVPITDQGTRSGGSKPRALTEDEVRGTIRDYATAARNAVEGAGFDGVEIHGANGYLVDQFIQDVSNHRTDAWGGSIEKRSRFALEVAKACVDAVGAEKVGIRLSPWSRFQSMRMREPIPQFSHVIKGLKELGLAYLHIVESRISGSADVESTDKNLFAIDLWRGTENSPLLIAGGFSPASARRLVDEEHREDDLGVVFGRYFISNPDLVYRVKKGIELTKYDRALFYTPEAEKGYTDYSFSDEFQHDSKESRL